MKLRRKIAQHKTSAMDRLLRWQAEVACEQAARLIEATGAGPGGECEDPYCPDFLRHGQLRQDAATVRRAGRMLAQGRTPVAERQPPCPAAVAALAKMETAALR